MVGKPASSFLIFGHRCSCVGTGNGFAAIKSAHDQRRQWKGSEKRAVATDRRSFSALSLASIGGGRNGKQPDQTGLTHPSVPGATCSGVWLVMTSNGGGTGMMRNQLSPAETVQLFALSSKPHPPSHRGFAACPTLNCL